VCVDVWAISVPENNLKYAKFSGRHKSHLNWKTNKLISPVRTEKGLPLVQKKPYALEYL